MLGIILKISLLLVDSACCTSYFHDDNQSIIFDFTQDPEVIPNSNGIASKFMSLKRFKQIRGAFHPEDKIPHDPDKCYQLRHAINTINVASKSIFNVGGHLTFDEGSVGCCSRFCPVRQYNKDKPQMFRVDFFILSYATIYCILHLNVYQGKNDKNILVHPDLHCLATTQKAVMNVVYSLGLNDETQKAVMNVVYSLGLHDETRPYARHIALDNQYQCPKLAVLPQMRANIYSTGTMQKNQKGWNSELMNQSNKIKGGT